MLDNDTSSAKGQFRTLWISYEDIFVGIKPVDQTNFCGPNLIKEVSYGRSEGTEGNVIIMQNPVRDWDTT